LKHDARGLAAPTLAWDTGGFYVVKIFGNNEATEEIHLAPRPDDWNKPWGEQRMRVLDVQVTQRGVLLYHVELDSHAQAVMAPPAACDFGRRALSLRKGRVESADRCVDVHAAAAAGAHAAPARMIAGLSVMT